MALGGSFKPETFGIKDPFQMKMQKDYWNWDTQNPFARGNQGVKGMNINPMQFGKNQFSPQAQANPNL